MVEKDELKTKFDLKVVELNQTVSDSLIKAQEMTRKYDDCNFKRGLLQDRYDKAFISLR